MTALRFYTDHQQNGRALLRGDPLHFFNDKYFKIGRPLKDYQPDMWLIRHRGRLVLCTDTMQPAKRRVDDRERVEEISWEDCDE